MCLKEGYVSMVVICDTSDIIEYDQRISELSNAALCMKQDTNSIEKNTLKLTCMYASNMSHWVTVA